MKRCQTIVDPADDTNIRAIYFDAAANRIPEPTNCAAAYARQHPTPAAYEVTSDAMIDHCNRVAEWMRATEEVSA